MNVNILSHRPKVVVYENAMSKYFCKLVVQAYKNKFERSQVMNTTTGRTEVDEDYRTSSSCIMKWTHPLSRLMIHKVCKLMDVEAQQCELITLTKYETGQQYKKHCDYFTQKIIDENPNIQLIGNRIATAIIYLQACEEGGHTSFPKLGISVPPTTGNILSFWYNYNSRTNESTSHSGDIVEKGTKYIATVWIRQGKNS
jgi:prolyl 4-hydroxylase